MSETAAPASVPGRPAFGPADTVRVALWLALAAGLLEGAYRLYQVARGGTIGMSPHVIWMAPVANLVWLAIPLALFALLGQLRRSRSQRPAVTALLFVAVLGLILLYQGMHKGAAVVLAAGIAWQLAPRLMRSTGFLRLAGRSIVVLALLAIGGGIAIRAVRWNDERQMLAAQPKAEGKPNILFLVWDTVRGYSMSVYGYPRPTTPFLERFAAEGARFDLAMSTAPWTLPSHGSMFTGHRPVRLSARLNTPLDDRHPVLAEAFTGAGYATGGFAANMSYVSREHGLARGFSHYRDFVISPSGILGSSRLGVVLLKSERVRRAIGYYELAGRKTAGRVNDEFLDWVDGGDGRPFFAFLNYFDAHQPYLAPAAYRERLAFDTGAPFWPRLVDAKYRDMSAEEIEWSRGEYDATIAYLDAELERLAGELERRGLLDNTIVVLTSDHGEHFGEHRRISHGNSLYRHLLQVPLIIRYPPRVPGGTVVTTPVSLADLPRTLVELAGIGASFPGRSLARFFGGYQGDSSEVVLSEMPTLRGARAYSLVGDGHHYIRWFERPPQLFRLEGDTGQTNDLASAPASADLLHHFAILETRYAGLPADTGRTSQ